MYQLYLQYICTISLSLIIYRTITKYCQETSQEQYLLKYSGDKKTENRKFRSTYSMNSGINFGWKGKKQNIYIWQTGTNSVSSCDVMIAYKNDFGKIWRPWGNYVNSYVWKLRSHDATGLRPWWRWSCQLRVSFHECRQCLRGENEAAQ